MSRGNLKKYVPPSSYFFLLINVDKVDKVDNFVDNINKII